MCKIVHAHITYYINVTLYHYHITHLSFLFIFELAAHLNTSLKVFEFCKNEFTLYGLGYRQYR